MASLEALRLAPLIHSAQADQIEAELKQQFLDLFDDHLRDLEREINVYGAPHLGSLQLVERHVSRDGLALLRSVDPSMRYLFKAWKARNPKRGMHFLKTYLQLLYPNGWRVDQLWQDKAKTYPLGLVARGAVDSNAMSGTHYLTSRVRVSIDSESNDGSEFASITPALRAVVPAKFVLEISMLRKFESEFALSNGGFAENFVHLGGEIESMKIPMSSGIGCANAVAFQRIAIFDNSI